MAFVIRPSALPGFAIEIAREFASEYSREQTGTQPASKNFDLLQPGINHLAVVLPVVATGVSSLRRPAIRDGEFAGAIRVKLEKPYLGVWISCRQLASVDLAFAHAGLPTLRSETGRTSPHERPVACRQHGPSFFMVELNDRGHVAQCLCGRAICLASLTCGIRGLGRGTQRRPERMLLDGHAALVWSLCSSAKRLPLSRHPDSLHPRADVKTHSGDPTLRAALAGFLAIETNDHR